MKNTRKTILMILGLAIASLMIPVAVNLADKPLRLEAKTLKKYILPVSSVPNSIFGRFCSSSAVQVKEKVLTLTNSHCCRMAYEGMLRIGQKPERIILNYKNHDLCVLTSSLASSPIRLPKRRVRKLIPGNGITIAGFPRGGPLALTTGVMGQPYSIGVGKTNFVSNIVYALAHPGSSGSPVFNGKGRLVGVLYAGNLSNSLISVTVPLVHVRIALRRGYLLSKEYENH